MSINEVLKSHIGVMMEMCTDNIGCIDCIFMDGDCELSGAPVFWDVDEIERKIADYLDKKDEAD